MISFLLQRTRVPAAGAALLIVTAGCYTYQPVTTVAIGDQVQATLTTEEAIRQSEVGGEPLRAIDGTVLGASDEMVSIQVVTARSQSMMDDFQFTRRYDVPRTGIAQLNYRKLSTPRTIGVAAVVGGLVYLILDSTIIGAGGNGPGENGDPANTITRIRIGW